MQFYRFWTKGESSVNTPQGSGSFQAYGYSNVSVEDALRVARERANALGNRILSGQAQQHYYGGNSPLREEIVEELQEDGETVAVISRNSQGCLVLNSSDIFFADIDAPEQKSNPIQSNPIGKMIMGLFKGNKDLEPLADALDLDGGSPDDFETSVIQRIEALVANDRSLLIRLYRTSNGFRAMILNERIPCQVSRSASLLQAFESDELYVSLCRSQDCYRARLTPKPWRIDLLQPSVRYPFEKGQREVFDQWLEGYNAAIGNYAACALIGNFGSGGMDPLAEKIVQVHDMMALNDPHPLA